MTTPSSAALHIDNQYHEEDSSCANIVRGSSTRGLSCERDPKNTLSVSPAKPADLRGLLDSELSNQTDNSETMQGDSSNADTQERSYESTSVRTYPPIGNQQEGPETSESTRHQTLRFRHYLRLAPFDGFSRQSIKRDEPAENMTPGNRHWTKLDCVCNELHQTEKAYFATVNKLLDYFFNPLLEFSDKESIELGALKELHASLAVIQSIHKALLEMLAPSEQVRRKKHINSCSVDVFRTNVDTGEVISSTIKSDAYIAKLMGKRPIAILGRHHPALADRPVTADQLAIAFTSVVDYMKAYATFCYNYSVVKEQLVQLQDNFPTFHTFITALQVRIKTKHSIDITQELVKPVQRICRYPLFFKQMAKHARTPEEGNRMHAAWRKVEAISSLVDEKVLEAKNNALLFKYHKLLKAGTKISLMLPCRNLLFEAETKTVALDKPRLPRCLSWLSPKGGEGFDTEGYTSDELDIRRASVIPLTNAYGNSSDAIHTRQHSVPLTRRIGALITRHHSSQENKKRCRHYDSIHLLLLSDVLLMAKTKETKLKVKRQLCLACASIRKPRDKDLKEMQGWRRDQINSSLILEAAKIGRCSCHKDMYGNGVVSPKASFGRFHRRHTSNGDYWDAHPSVLARPKVEHYSPFSAIQRYLIVCSSEPVSNECLMLTKKAIAHCERVRFEASSTDSSRYQPLQRPSESDYIEPSFL